MLPQENVYRNRNGRHFLIIHLIAGFITPARGIISPLTAGKAFNLYTENFVGTNKFLNPCFA